MIIKTETMSIPVYDETHSTKKGSVLTTSRGYSPVVHMCRVHNSAVTPCAPLVAPGKPEHHVPV